MQVKRYDWDQDKNTWLKETREIGFEDIIIAINEGNSLAILDHHKPDKYPTQKILVVNINDYVYLVPFVEDEEKRFLKTIYPSRKMTKKYLKERSKK